LVEFGRAIRITYRNEYSARSMLIRVYHCEFQYKRDLKAERQCQCTGGAVTAPEIDLPKFIYVEFLKYGSGDTSESS